MQHHDSCTRGSVQECEADSYLRLIDCYIIRGGLVFKAHRFEEDSYLRLIDVEEDSYLRLIDGCITEL